jgi:hypothetical protein
MHLFQEVAMEVSNNNQLMGEDIKAISSAVMVVNNNMAVEIKGVTN